MNIQKRIEMSNRAVKRKLTQKFRKDVKALVKEVDYKIISIKQIIRGIKSMCLYFMETRKTYPVKEIRRDKYNYYILCSEILLKCLKEVM